MTAQRENILPPSRTRLFRPLILSDFVDVNIPPFQPPVLPSEYEQQKGEELEIISPLPSPPLATRTFLICHTNQKTHAPRYPERILGILVDTLASSYPDNVLSSTNSLYLRNYKDLHELV